MIWFDVLPPIPSGYHRLSVLLPEEIPLLKNANYVSDDFTVNGAVGRPGSDNCADDIPDDIADWRIKTFVVWFCYLFENFLAVRDPIYAMEELMLEFHGPMILDLPQRILSTLYAGMGRNEDLSASERLRQREWLKPHYELAIGILSNTRTRL